MTVGSEVRTCLASIKSAEATLLLLATKVQKQETMEAFKEAEQLLSEIKNDLQQQVMFLAREEPQY